MKRKYIKIISFVSAGFLILSGFLIRQIFITEKYKKQIENSYSKSMYNLSECLNNISTDLEKTKYIESNKTFSSYASKIYCEAEIAKEALSKLPGDNSKLKTVNLFLSQVGNYSLSLSKYLIEGKELTEIQKDTIQTLLSVAKTISGAVEKTKAEINNPEYWGMEIENKVKKTVDSSTLASSLTELEEKLSDFPTLVYDGPYSDHILSKQPTMLYNKPEISKRQAENLSKSVAQTNDNLSFLSTQKGKIECYLFGNDRINVSISKHGGYPVYMIKSRNILSEKLSNEEMVNKAFEYLCEQGFENMELSYYELSDGILTCNFAYKDKDTVCYTDLIKVGVAADNGEIMSLEAVGYLTNHTNRIFSTPKFTDAEAFETLSHDLTVESNKIALIPTSGGGEVRCYEFKCSNEENDILIYINVSTLECEDVLIMLVNENGTLVK